MERTGLPAGGILRTGVESRKWRLVRMPFPLYLERAQCAERSLPAPDIADLKFGGRPLSPPEHVPSVDPWS